MITDKKRVTMTNKSMLAPGLEALHEAVDYVPEGDLAEYVASARTRWQSVEVSDEYDAGPGGV